MRGVAVNQNGATRQQSGTLVQGSVWESIREFFRKCWLSLSKTDLALQEGKTLEMLQERLVGFHGIKDLQVDQSRNERDKRVVRVFVLSSRTLTDQEKAFVHTIVDDVNGRFGTHMFASISSSRGK